MTEPTGQEDPMTENREIVRGTPVVPGIAYAPVIWPAARPEVTSGLPRVDESGRDEEKIRFEEAAAVVAQRLRDRAATVSGAAAEVLQANAAMAADRGWLGAAQKLIAGGAPAEEAASEATEQFAALFTKMGGLMAERVTDLRDIRDRVVSELRGLPEPGIPVPDAPSILCARDLAPADTAGLDPASIVGLVTLLGGRPATPRSSRGSSAFRAWWQYTISSRFRPALPCCSTVR